MTRTPAQARAVRIEEALVELLAALDVGGEAVARAAEEARAALVQSPGQGPGHRDAFTVQGPTPHDRDWRVGPVVSSGESKHVNALHALMRRAGVPREAYVPPYRPDGRRPVLVGGYYRLTAAQMESVREALGMVTGTTLNDTP